MRANDGGKVVGFAKISPEAQEEVEE
jgi:hypothetical protein